MTNSWFFLSQTKPAKKYAKNVRNKCILFENIVIELYKEELKGELRLTFAAAGLYWKPENAVSLSVSDE